MPRHSNNGELQQVSAISEPPAETGETTASGGNSITPAVNGRTIRQTAGNPTGRLDPQQTPADQCGRTRNASHRFH